MNAIAIAEVNIGDAASSVETADFEDFNLGQLDVVPSFADAKGLV